MKKSAKKPAKDLHRFQVYFWGTGLAEDFSNLLDVVGVMTGHMVSQIPNRDGPALRIAEEQPQIPRLRFATLGMTACEVERVL
jgi:hypothetical protein